MAALALAQTSPNQFSHARHAPLKQPCTACHEGAVAKARATFPLASTCKTCHVDRPAVGEGVRIVPAKRVYRLPDFAVFSHGKHAQGKVDCATCHGEVMKTEAIDAPFRAVNMKACVDCHKSRGATLVCTACHELGQ